MKIYMKPIRGDNLEFDITNEMTVEEFKEKVKDKLNCNKDHLKLAYIGQILENGKTMGDYGFKEDAIMVFVISKPPEPKPPGGTNAFNPTFPTNTGPGGFSFPSSPFNMPGMSPFPGSFQPPKPSQEDQAKFGEAVPPQRDSAPIPNPLIKPPSGSEVPQPQARPAPPMQLPRVVEPSEEVIASLVEMGFEREIAIDALKRTQNNREAAIQLLFDGEESFEPPSQPSFQARPGGMPGMSGGFPGMGGDLGGMLGGLAGMSGGLPGRSGGQPGGNSGGMPGMSGGFPGMGGDLASLLGGLGMSGGLPGRPGGQPGANSGGMPGMSGGFPGMGGDLGGMLGGLAGMSGGLSGRSGGPGGNSGGMPGMSGGLPGMGGDLAAMLEGLGRSGGLPGRSGGFAGMQQASPQPMGEKKKNQFAAFLELTEIKEAKNQVEGNPASIDSVIQQLKRNEVFAKLIETNEPEFKRLLLEPLPGGRSRSEDSQQFSGRQPGFPQFSGGFPQPSGKS
mmetsp:Transcript_32064/g.55324  ORF Transcript_32064/g.55324 Transcript_32064/m.55324 type:complete len:504 (+) Transcript_32064:15-1526(+)